MSHPNPRHGTLLSQNTDFDGGADQPGIAQPISQSEIEDLLYSEERSLDERIARLIELRDEAEARVSADIGGDDAQRLHDELVGALATLQGDSDNADDSDAFAALGGAYEVDPADHLDSLSPDDVDGRAAIEGDDIEDAEGSYAADLEDLDDAVIHETGERRDR